MSMWGGGGFGGPVGGGHSPGRPGGNLPFAGIPSEMQAGVDSMLAEEPEHPEPTVTFTHVPAAAEQRRLTLAGLVSAHPLLLAGAVTLVVLVAVVAQAGPKLTELAIDRGMTPGHHDLAVVGLMAALYLVATTVTALSQRWQARVTGRLAASVLYDLRLRVFSHLQRLSLDFFTEEKAGVLMSRMTSDIENLQQLLQDGLWQFAVQGLTMMVITALLFSMDVRLALLTVAMVLPVLVAMSAWFHRASQRAYQRVRDGIADVLADLSESLHGYRIVVAHNRQRHNVVHHRSVVGEYRDANVATARISAFYGPGTQMVGTLAQAALLAVGGTMVIHRELSIGALVAFFLYLNRFFQPIQLLAQQYNAFQQGNASVLKLRTLLETDPSVSEEPDAAELPAIEGEITFENVTFGYDPDQPVVTAVDLRIAPGETVAFVGPTGAGKSTLAKLITRFYDPTGGRVCIDGHDLRHVTLGSLRRQLGVVPQEPFLFAGTLRENIAFARPHASDDDVWAAVAAVGLTDLVARLPDGLDTVVHERGQSLSSGERQLIALARAFLAQPRVLVLDEATSNLDLQSETRVEAALDVLLQARTAVLIAHRLSTAMRADWIAVVDGGRIVEQGSHAELVDRGGRYAAMYETWVRQAALAEGEAGAGDGTTVLPEGAATRR